MTGVREPSVGNHDGDVLVQVSNISVSYPVRGGLLQRKRGELRAVEDVSFAIRRGETLGLVGESGSGKTTLARAIMRIVDTASGSITLGELDLLQLSGEELRQSRRRFQMVFQDPYGSLDPRQTIGSALAEPMASHGLYGRPERSQRVRALLERVGLDATFEWRYPHELSGGQRQRIGIARALALEPELVVCDEPVSALDVSIQAQVINLLADLQRDLGLTYLFIAHDLAVVRHIASRVAVMYLGRIVEVGSVDDLFEAPRHPYTFALLSAVRIPDARTERGRKRIILQGDIPSPADPPTGCRFHTRCWLRTRLRDPEVCVTTAPELTPVGSVQKDHAVACHFPTETQTAVEASRADELKAASTIVVAARSTST